MFYIVIVIEEPTCTKKGGGTGCLRTKVMIVNYDSNLLWVLQQLVFVILKDGAY